MNREEAWNLLTEYTKSASLLKHALCVEAAMRHYARTFGEDEDTWGITGLIHDFDYERWPDPPAHTHEGARILRDRAVAEEIVSAILSHADWNQEEYPRDRPIRKTLFAVNSRANVVTFALKVVPQRLKQVLLVLDNKYSLLSQFL